MRCVKITDPVDAFCLINRIEQKCDIVKVFGDGHTREDIYDIFMYNSEIYKFMSDDFSKLYACAILEHVEDRVANIHFSMFQAGHILRGYKLLLESIRDKYDLLVSYIEDERQDILKLLRLIGFNVRKINNGKYYGQINIKAKTQSTKA